MEIKKKQTNDELMIEIMGKLDAKSSNELEKELNTSLEGIKELTMDLSQLKYVSSAGLRILIIAQKMMQNQGKMTIKNVTREVKAVLEMTGFINFLNIE